MTWIVTTLRVHPEVALFATLALGHALGRLRIGPLQLNPIIGVLIVGILLGQLGIVVPDALKWTFFMLFVFSIGYSIGPQFFRGLRAGGLSQIAVTLVFCGAGLATTLVLARVFHLSAGAAGGLLAGGLTESAALGTASDAITRLPVDDAVRTELANDTTIAFAVTYLIGLLGTTWSLAWLAPRLMRVDLAAECRKLEAQLGVASPEAGVISAYRAFVARAYVVPASLDGRTVAALEQAFAPQRVFVERLARRGEITTVEPETALAAGDRIALSARHETLASNANPLHDSEVDDPQLLDIPAVEVDVVLTRRDLADQSLGEIAQRVDREAATRGVFVRKITRSGQELPLATGTVLERGDVLTLVGAKTHVQRIASRVGIVEWPGVATDLITVSATIAIGGLVGLLTVSIGGFAIGLSLAVGVLLGGLLIGWLRSLFPVLGRVPPAGLALFDSLGLTAFLAAIALNAAPGFVQGVRESGAVLIASGFVLGTLPHTIAVLVGRYVFRLHPGLLLGIMAGAATQPAALAAVQDVARSKVPTLGYGVSYAVGNVLLALWGSVVVVLLAP